MATKSKLTAAEKKDLEAIGYVEGSPNIPENISPVLKAKLLEQWQEDNEGAELPDATYRQNAIVRERIEAEEAGDATPKRQGDASKG